MELRAFAACLHAPMSCLRPRPTWTNHRSCSLFVVLALLLPQFRLLCSKSSTAQNLLDYKLLFVHVMMLLAARRAGPSLFRKPVILPASKALNSLRSQSSGPLSPQAIDELLATPSWSVASLQSPRNANESPATITKEQLHHLLRLSALSLPETQAEEEKMIETLESQLHFVEAIQSIDTTGVEPLQSIRDETMEAERENQITVETLQSELEKEESVGFARRIVRKQESAKSDEPDNWDLLKQAPNKLGRYIVVDTKTC